MTPEARAHARTLIKARLGDYPTLHLHLVSAHCNGAALGLTEAEALADHDHEHTGPGTIRNHDRADLFFDADKIADVILECADEYDTDAEVLAEVERLMRRADVRRAMSAAEHAHDWAPRRGWTVCPAGEGCQVYPRCYDAVLVTDADGGFLSESVAEVPDERTDILDGLVKARSALGFADALLSDVTDHRAAGVVALTEAALVRLQHSMRLAEARLRPPA